MDVLPIRKKNNHVSIKVLDKTSRTPMIKGMESFF